MLIPAKIITIALKEFSVRNRLIKQFNCLRENDKNNFYKQILIFWLGSNTSLFNLKQDPLFNELFPYIYVGYYCILILDKHISVLDERPASFAQLVQCRQEIIMSYNKSYALLKKNPHKLFLKFKSILEKIDVNFSPQLIQRHIVRQTKKLCLLELNRALLLNPKDFALPTPETMQISNARLSWGIIFKRDLISIQMNRLITGAFHLFPFYISPTTIENYRSQKIFIRARDGMILDGLMVNNKQLPSKTVVLSLVGHFQSEHCYFDNSYVEFNKIFSSDMIFINHRNYSVRSYYSAKNIDELARDVVQFAEYFNDQRKHIVLYGMCGGSAHMILAANMLRTKKIPFKLIVDRFPAKYSHFLDFKTLIRVGRSSQSVVSPLFYTPHTILLWTMILSLSSVAQLLFCLSNTNINFADRLRFIPENDCLILQAKSKKRAGMAEPQFTDIVVHPKNDLRHAMKDRRHKNKVILKRLIKYCDGIADLYICAEPIQRIFLKLSECFTQYLQLIDNEKLTLNRTASSSVNDLHAYKLYELTTRHQLPMQQFLKGFFTKPAQICNINLRTLATYADADIFEALNKLDKFPHATEVADLLSFFLMDIRKHENFIGHVGNRLFATGLGNVNSLLQELLDSKLFYLISKHHLNKEANMSNPDSAVNTECTISFPTAMVRKVCNLGAVGKIGTGVGLFAGASIGGAPAALLYGLWGLAGGTMVDKLSGACRKTTSAKPR